MLLTESPAHFHAAGIYDPPHAHAMPPGGLAQAGADNGGVVGITQNGWGGIANGNGTLAASTGVRVNSSNGIDTTYSAGGGGAHKNVQPTITCNYVIRIL